MSVIADYMVSAYNRMTYEQKQKLQDDIINQQAYQYQNQYQNQYNSNATMEDYFKLG